jgi:hypothetical protein
MQCKNEENPRMEEISLKQTFHMAHKHWSREVISLTVTIKIWDRRFLTLIINDRRLHLHIIHNNSVLLILEICFLNKRQQCLTLISKRRIRARLSVMKVIRTVIDMFSLWQMTKSLQETNIKDWIRVKYWALIGSFLVKHCRS